MTKVTLVWFVLQATHSPQAVGILLLCYTGPVVVGGLVAGTLLDRFERRRVMLVDNLIRGVAVGLIPTAKCDRTSIAVACLRRGRGLWLPIHDITLAGSPALIPSIVAPEQLATANALETLSFTVSGVVVLPVAGILLAWISAPNVLLLDALSYGIFALALTRLIDLPTRTQSPQPGRHPLLAYSLVSRQMAAALRLLIANIPLLATTLMFMAFNIGEGMLFVWLPLLAARANSVLGVQAMARRSWPLPRRTCRG